MFIYSSSPTLEHLIRWLSKFKYYPQYLRKEPYFDLVVFVYVPQDIRLERRKHREYERYGDRILLGGDRYKDSKDFIEWAAAYDCGTRTGRSLLKHKAWITKLNCPVIEVENYNLKDSVQVIVEINK